MFWFTRSRIQQNRMSIASVAFCLRREFAKLTAIVLLTWIKVGGCVCPISSTQTRRRMKFLADKKVEPISVYVVEFITFLIIFDRTWVTPLERGMEGFVALEKVSPKK